MIQWYGANGLTPRTELARIAAAVGAGRKTAHPGAGARVLAQCLQCLAHGAESLGADVVDRRTGTLGRPAAGIRQVGGVDELIDVVAGTEHGHGRTVGDPVEEDAEDPQPPVPQDRARPHDRDVQPPGDRRPAQQLGVELGASVGLHGPGLGGAGHRVRLGHAEDRRRRGVHDLGDPGTFAGPQQHRRAADVDRLEQAAVLGQRHLGDVVEHHVDAGDGTAHRRGVPDVSPDELHIGGAVGGVDQVEHPHLVAGGTQVLDQERPEVAAAPGDQSRPDAHAVGSWWRDDPVRGPRS